MVIDALHVLARACAAVRRNLPTLIAIHVIVAIAAAAVAGPMVTWAADGLLAASGSPTVNNFDLIALGRSIPGVAIVLLLALSFFLGKFIHEGLAVTAALEQRDTLGAIRVVLTSAPRLVKLAIAEILLVVLAMLPFAAIIATAAWLLLGEHDINYYLAEHPPEFRRLQWIAAPTAAAAIAVLWAMSVHLSFAVALTLFEREGPLRAVRRSTLAVWRTWPVTIPAHLLLTAALLAVTWLVGVLLWGVQHLALSLADPRHVTSVLVVAALVITLEAAAAAVLSFVTFALRATTIAELYRSAFTPPEPATRAESPASRRWGLALAALLIVSGTVGACWLIVHDLRIEDQTLISAHRGASLRAPENTASAIEAAIQDGADIVEIDVQETSDGQIVVLHDKDLMRIASDPRNVWEITADEIRQVDIGHRFAPEFAGQRVPTLREVIDQVRGRAKLLIELKYNGHDVALAPRVVGIVRDERFQSDCLVMSLDTRGVAELRRLAPEIKVGLTISRSMGDLSKLDVDFLSVSLADLTPAHIARYRRAVGEVHVWTVDTPADMQRCFDLGVDNIITNDTALAVELREERASLTLPERVLLTIANRMR